MPSSPDVVVVIGAQAWRNWSRYELEAAILMPTDAWLVEAKNPTSSQIATLQAGSAVQVLVDGATALRGWLERVQLRHASDGLTVTLQGRDWAAPLVDCAPGPSWSWRGLSLDAVAKKAIAELGIAARVTSRSTVFATRSAIQAEAGETYWAVLERYAKRLGVAVWATPDARLHLSVPDYEAASVGTLRHGGASANVLEATWSDDITGRRSPLTVVGQARGTDQVYGAAACHIQVSATDADLVAAGLYRPGWIDDGEVASTAEARARASWEVSRRQLEGEQLEALVRGHGPASGQVWTPGTMVAVEDAVFGVSGSWWVAARRLVGDRGGARTLLQLRRPGLWLPEAA